MHDHIISSLNFIDKLNINDELIIWGLRFFKFWSL
jgi:hypothetical protein